MSDTNPYRILLADDHAILRQSLETMLKEQPNLEVVGEAGDGAELLHLLNSKPDAANPCQVFRHL